MTKLVGSSLLVLSVLVGSTTIANSQLYIDMKIVEHGGGLDKNGCHHDRKRGGYHCH